METLVPTFPEHATPTGREERQGRQQWPPHCGEQWWRGRGSTPPAKRPVGGEYKLQRLCFAALRDALHPSSAALHTTCHQICAVKGARAAQCATLRPPCCDLFAGRRRMRAAPGRVGPIVDLVAFTALSPRANTMTTGVQLHLFSTVGQILCSVTVRTSELCSWRRQQWCAAARRQM